MLERAYKAQEPYLPLALWPMRIKGEGEYTCAGVWRRRRIRVYRRTAWPGDDRRTTSSSGRGNRRLCVGTSRITLRASWPIPVVGRIQEITLEYTPYCVRVQCDAMRGGSTGGTEHGVDGQGAEGLGLGHCGNQVYAAREQRYLHTYM